MEPKDGAKAVILSQDKILLFHRDNKPNIRYPDYWHLVGGGIEKGETPEAALIREVKEEASYDLKNYKLLAQTKGQQGENLWIFVIFIDKSEEVKFKLGKGEGQEIGWFTIDQSLELKLTPGTRILFTHYRKLIEEMMDTRKVPARSKININSQGR